MKNVIVVPTYNEKENIRMLIPLIFKTLPNIFVTVADDNSPDGTALIVKEFQKTYPNLRLISQSGKNGLGKAYINAFKEVLRDREVKNIIMMDADLSLQPKYLPLMLKKSEEYSVVTGSRYVRGSKIEGWELWRRVLSFCGNFYCRMILPIPVKDYTCGFNVIKASLLRSINLDTMDASGYAFIIELKYLLYKAGATFVEIPITFIERAGGESKISSHIISEGVLAPWKMLFSKKNATKKTWVKKTACSLCEKESAFFFSRKNGHDLYRCETCKLLFVHPIPLSVEVYDKTYFAGADDGFGYVDYDADKIPMVPVFEKYLDIVATHGITKGRLLDIGAATGFFMDIAKKRGFEVIGVELSDYAAQKGREKGLNVVTSDLKSADFGDEIFDIVTMFDVLEHVPDPKDFLLEAKRILRPGGLLVINTPNGDSAVARFLGSKWHLIVPPEHLHYFSPKNTGNYLIKNGFNVKVATSIGKRFTLQYIFKTLYRWQKFPLWDYIERLFTKKPLAKLYIPLNTHDNFFLIAEKNN